MHHFSLSANDAVPPREEWMNDSKHRRHETTIWQRRFWKDLIRNETDYRRHMDYLHYNPVKHGLVQEVKE